MGHVGMPMWTTRPLHAGKKHHTDVTAHQRTKKSETELTAGILKKDQKVKIYKRLTEHFLIRQNILLEEPNWQQLFAFVFFTALKKRIPSKISILSCFD